MRRFIDGKIIAALLVLGVVGVPAQGQTYIEFTVAAPESVAALHDDDFRTDDRLRGAGTVVVEDAGAGEIGIPLMRVRFTAAKLESDTRAAIGIEGTLVCPKM